MPRDCAVSPALLAVARQHLFARFADLGAVLLQAAEYAQHILRIDLELELAILGHIRVAGSAFLIVALAHRGGDRRRLGWHLLRVRGRA